MKKIYKVLLIVVLSLWAIIGSHFILYSKSEKYRDKFNDIFNNDVVEDPLHEYLRLLAILTGHYDVYWDNVQVLGLLEENDPNRVLIIETIDDCVTEYNKVTSENPKFLKHEMFSKHLPARLSPLDELSKEQIFDHLAYKVRYLYYSYMRLYEEYRLNTLDDFMIEFLIQQKEEYNSLLEQYKDFVLSSKFPLGFPKKIKDEIIPLPEDEERSYNQYFNKKEDYQ